MLSCVLSGALERQALVAGLRGELDRRAWKWAMLTFTVTITNKARKGPVDRCHLLGLIAPAIEESIGLVSCRTAQALASFS